MAETKSAKKTPAKKAKSTGKRLSVTLDEETMTLFLDYIAECGCSKDEFVKKAIREKISREKISGMIDTMIRL